MMEIRRISTARWWNKKKIWKLFICLLCLVFIRVSKGSLFKDFYYFISKPFWPGQYQNEIINNSLDQELQIKLKILEDDNLRLRNVLSLQRIEDDNKITAAVISRKTGNWWKQIILNKGKKDGIKIGNSVVGPGGLLGIVDNTSLYTSTVRLLTSPENKVGVWIERIKSHGLLVGLGSDYPKLIFYTKDIDLKVGDYVISSPASTLLPPNIPIGVIQFIDLESDPNITAKVKLLANPQSIDWVQILKVKI